VRLLVDEMYPPALADGLRAAGIEATTAAALGMAGSSDAQVFAAAVGGGYAVLTENVGDFTPIAAEHSVAGGRHHGLVIALASRFSRRPQGRPSLIAAIEALADTDLADRIVYLKRA
jgi:hypothetical protein